MKTKQDYNCGYNIHYDITISTKCLGSFKRTYGILTVSGVSVQRISSSRILLNIERVIITLERVVYGFISFFISTGLLLMNFIRSSTQSTKPILTKIFRHRSEKQILVSLFYILFLRFVKSLQDGVIMALKNFLSILALQIFFIIILPTP